MPDWCRVRSTNPALSVAGFGCLIILSLLPLRRGSLPKGRLRAGGVGVALGAQMVCRLGRLHVRGMRAGGFYHCPELFRIFQHGTGTEHVVVEGLTVVIGHEHGGLHGFRQGLLADIGIGIVDEYTGIHVAVGIAPSGRKRRQNRKSACGQVRS